MPAEAGVDLVLNARGAEALEQTAEEISRCSGKRPAVAADITTDEGRAAVLSLWVISILVTNAGGPPPGLWSDWDRDDFIAAIDANMLTPITLIKSVLPGMMEQGWGRIVNIITVRARADPTVGIVKFARAGLTVCRGHIASGRTPWCDDQQSTAGHPRDRSRNFTGW